jgi:hypothetical protein
MLRTAAYTKATPSSPVLALLGAVQDKALA